MKTRVILYRFVLLTALWLGGCYTVPETGRTSVNFMPESMLSEQAAMAFAQMQDETTVSRSRVPNQRVREIGRRILEAAKETGNLPDADQWEFVVFDDAETVNAFAMPGGKVGVYTGILNLAESEDELAVILGHEIAHVSARHGNERMSQAVLLTTGGIALGYAVKDEDQTTKEAVMIAYGLGAALGAQLPFSRLHENEADEIGLIYMAKAGYDPRVAPRFWEKMAALGGEAPAEFMSTHPSHGTRVRRLSEQMPRAMAIYEQNKYKRDL